MKAILCIELELLEPILLESAAQMRELTPEQIRWVSIMLTVDHGEDGGDENEGNPVTFTTQSSDAHFSIRDLVLLAQHSQPEGTDVLVWYQGRSERFVI